MSDPHLISNLTWEKANELIDAYTEEISSENLCPNPLASVRVSTYQHEAFVRQCMDGILDQVTDFPFEIVVGDDGSTDGAFKILSEYQKQNPDKIRLFRSVSNLGRYTGSGLLNGIRIRRACRGKYIALLEGDDYWTSPDKLQRQVDLLESNNELSAAFHDVEIIGDWAGEQIFVDYGDKTLIGFDDLMTFETPIAFGSLVLRESCMTMDDFPEWRLNAPVGDILTFAQLASKGPIARIPEKLGVYRRHAGGMTSDGTLNSFDNSLRMLNMFRNMRHHFAGGPADDYFDYRIRSMVRVLFKRSRRPAWNQKHLFASLRELAKLPLGQILLTIQEHFGRNNKYQS
ncbi:glycosyltransferase [Haloferula sp. A504]|uniref:glycosyltransferase n=1 Tax=Haloferula sp. A504 TaxID=3373601 RepID=UPI0031C1E1ED|nr:glycosyltransferase [Verrucomicrobiaceae bacterium E54]